MFGAVISTAVFVWWERRVTEPIFPPHLFANPIPAVAFVITLLVAAAMFAAIIFIPIYLQLVDGVSPALSGVLLLPLMGGMLVTSIGSGQLVSRIGRYKAFPVAGTALMTLRHVAALAPRAPHLAPDGGRRTWSSSAWAWAWSCSSLVLAVQNSVDRDDLGVSTSAISFFRNIGAAFGTALFGTILTSAARPLVAPARPRPHPFQPVLLVHDHAQGTAGAAAGGARRRRRVLRPVAARRLPGRAFPWPVLAFVFALMLKEIPLPTEARGQ